MGLLQPLRGADPEARQVPVSSYCEQAKDSESRTGNRPAFFRRALVTVPEDGGTICDLRLAICDLRSAIGDWSAPIGAWVISPGACPGERWSTKWIQAPEGASVAVGSSLLRSLRSFAVVGPVNPGTSPGATDRSPLSGLGQIPTPAVSAPWGRGGGGGWGSASRRGGGRRRGTPRSLRWRRH